MGSGRAYSQDSMPACRPWNWFADQPFLNSCIFWPEENKVLGTILIIVLILMLVGALPTWGHSRSWGYYPSGGLGLILVIIVVLVLLGRI